MAQKLGTTEISTVTNETPDGSTVRVRLEDGADLSMDRHLFQDNSTGRSFHFGKLLFETEADRKRKERGMQITNE